MSVVKPGIYGEPLISATEARGYIAEHAAAPDFVLLDVRTAGEIAEAHIAGARRLDIRNGEFEERLGTLDPAADYLLVCRSGNRSGYAAAQMLQRGFGRVRNMEGGMLAWQRQGYAVETGEIDAL